MSDGASLRRKDLTTVVELLSDIWFDEVIMVARVPSGVQGVSNGYQGYRKVAEVDRREGLPYDAFVRDYLEPQRPVLIKHAFPQWKALGKWTPEFFRREHGDRQVTVAGEVMTMAEYIDRVLASTPERPVPYLRELCVRRFAPALGADLTPFVDYALPNWLRGNYPDRELDHTLNRASEVELFIGGAGTLIERRRGEHAAGYGGLHGERIEGFVDLHYDPTACPVLLCQVYGQKEFILFSPGDTPSLYAQGRHSAVPNVFDPDFGRFPLLERATPYRFVQEPGDAIYVPPFWWHATRMRTVSIAVGSTFANAAHWPGVIEDVVGELGRSSPKKAVAMRAFLQADALVKRLAGPRFAESSHFREPLERQALALAKRVVKKAIGRG
jgi:histone arginine demethylase JMJD6